MSIWLVACVEKASLKSSYLVEIPSEKYDEKMIADKISKGLAKQNSMNYGGLVEGSLQIVANVPYDIRSAKVLYMNTREIEKAQKEAIKKEKEEKEAQGNSKKKIR